MYEVGKSQSILLNVDESDFQFERFAVKDIGKDWSLAVFILENVLDVQTH